MLILVIQTNFWQNNNKMILCDSVTYSFIVATIMYIYAFLWQIVNYIWIIFGDAGIQRIQNCHSWLQYILQK